MKAIKTTITVILGLILLAIVGVVITINVIDPKVIKDQLASQVKKFTGRDLIIAGDIHWSVFPWLKVQLNQAKLSNREGFSKPFLTAETLDVSIKLMPLLSKQIEISQVALDKVQVNAEINSQGVNNWDDMKKSTQPNAATPAKSNSSESARLQELHINEIALTHAQLNYEDQTKNQSLHLNDLNYRGNVNIANLGSKKLLDNIQSTSHFEVESVQWNKLTVQKIKMDLTLDQGAVTIAPLSLSYNEGEFNSKILLQPKGETYSLTASNIELSQPRFSYRDATKNTRINVEDLTYSGSITVPDIQAKNIVDTAQFTGKLKAKTLSVNQFTVANINTTFAGEQGKLRLSPISLGYNGGTLSSDITVGSHGQTVSLNASDLKITQPHFTYNDASKNLHVKAEDFTYSGNVNIPDIKSKNLVAEMQISGKLQAALFSYNQTTIEKINTTFSGRQGTIRLAPFSMGYNGGTVSSDLIITARGSQLSLDANKLDLSQPHFSYRHPTKGTQVELQNLSYHGNVHIANLQSKALLQQIRSTGEVKLGSLRVNRVEMNSMNSRLQTDAGRIHLGPTTASFYSGTINSDITLQQVRNSFSLRDNDSLKNVDTAALLTAMGSTDPISGKLSFSFQGGTADLNSVPRTLNGRGQIQLANGRINKLELVSSINKALSVLQLGNALHVGRDGDTPFSTMTGTFTIQNGVFNNRDLLLDSPTLKVTGNGNIDLNTKQIDYDVLADVTALTIGKSSDDKMIKLGGGIPLKISGTTNDPKVRPRMDLITKSIAKSLLNETENTIKNVIKLPSKEAIQKILNF